MIQSSIYYVCSALIELGFDQEKLLRAREI